MIRVKDSSKILQGTTLVVGANLTLSEDADGFIQIEGEAGGGGGLSEATANTLYLRLDGTNSMSATTLITNLNADLLDGQHGSHYLSRANHTGTEPSGAFAANTIAHSALANSAAAGLSVLGRSAASAGAFAEIAAGTDGHVLRRSGTTLGFGTLAGGAFADNTIAHARLVDIGQNFVLGRTAAGAGAVSAIATSALTGLSAAGITTGTLADARLSGNVVLENISNSFTTTNSFAAQILSSVATGTSPFEVDSTTVNVNLNADLLDGQHGAFYLDRANHSGTQAYTTLSYSGLTIGHVWRATSATAASFGTLTNAAFADNTIAHARLANSAAAGLSVLGRSAQSAGAFAEIAAGTDGHVLRRAGTALGFGTLAAGAFADNTIAHARLVDIGQNFVLGRTAAGTGAVSALATSALTGLSAAGITTGTLADARLSSNVVLENVSNVFTTSNSFGGQILSSVAQGVPPIEVDSTTLCTNVNADMLDGSHASAFALASHAHSGADITSGLVAVGFGGTGVANPTIGSLLIGAGTSAMTILACGAAGGYVRSNGSAWVRVSGVATSDLTGSIADGQLSGNVVLENISNSFTTTNSFAAQILSSVATGTSPFEVDSTTVNVNLNADLLDGQHGSHYLDRANHSGTQSASSITSGVFATTGGVYQMNVTAAFEIGNATGSRAPFEIRQATTGTDAFMAFNVAGDFACYFGLDGGINDLVVGGWSFGAVTHRIWHAGNDGASSGLDGDLLDGQHGSFYQSASNINAGTLADARLSANVVLENISNSFTTTNSFAGQILSSVATGTSPFEVDSTTVNVNLNADLLDGSHASAFALASHAHSGADITSGLVAVGFGGTGVANPTIGSLLIGAGTSAMTILACGAAGGYVRSNGSAWVRVSGVATSDLTGSIADGQLSGNVVLENISNSFTTTNSFAGQILSSVATGTSPFEVDSTTVNVNLNADLLDGSHASAFALASHAHSGADITSGTVADARLSSNIPLKNATNIFTTTNTFQGQVNMADPRKTSARRLKTRIEPLRGSPERLAALEPVSFAWRATDEVNIGFIADAVAGVDSRYGDEESWRQDAIIADLVSGWQSHDMRIAALERENRALRAALEAK